MQFCSEPLVVGISYQVTLKSLPVHPPQKRSVELVLAILVGYSSKSPSGRFSWQACTWQDAQEAVDPEDAGQGRQGRADVDVGPEVAHGVRGREGDDITAACGHLARILPEHDCKDVAAAAVVVLQYDVHGEIGTLAKKKK